MQAPTDKYLLQDYRDDMRTPAAPQMLDTDREIVPVKLIGNGLPKVNSKQRLRFYNFTISNTTSTVQVATPNAQYRYHFVGFTYMIASVAGNTCFVNIFDATSGTAWTDTATNGIARQGLSGAISGTGNCFPPVPVSVETGLRAYIVATGAASQIDGSIIYIEERI